MNGQRAFHAIHAQDPYPSSVAPIAVAGTVAGVAAAVAPGVTAYRSFNGIEAAAACQQLGLSPFGAQWVPSLAIEALSEEERGLNSDLNLHSNSELNPASTSGQPGGRRLRSGGQGRHAWGAGRVLLVSKDRLKSSSLAPFDEAQTMHRHRSAGGYESGGIMGSITATFAHHCHLTSMLLPLLLATPAPHPTP